MINNTQKITCNSNSEIELVKQLLEDRIRSVLIIYGESSLKSYGFLNKLTDQLNLHFINYYELSGIEQNNTENIIIETETSDVDAVIAVGGGTVIDNAKKICIKLPLYALPTIISSGSELNSYIFSKNKFEAGSQPKAIFFNPQLLTTLSPNYVTYSIIAVISRIIMENTNKNLEIIDSRVIELQKLIEKIYRKQSEMSCWEEVIKISNSIESCSVNCLANRISLVICRVFSIPYGASLSMIIPAWLKMRDYNPEIVNKLETWFHSQGSPIRFSEYNIEEDSFEKISSYFENESVEVSKILQFAK